MTTRIETSVVSLVTCSKCPHWTFLAGDRQEALRAAQAHESAVHPGSRRAAWRAAQDRKYRDTPKRLPSRVETS